MDKDHITKEPKDLNTGLPIVYIVNNPMNEKECITCHQIKSLSKFNVRNDGGNVTYRNQCKECRKKYWLIWEHSHKEQRKIEHHNEYLKAKTEGTLISFKQRCREKKEKYIKILGGKCQRCGYDKCFAAFDFHHINPEDKTKETREYFYKYFEKLVLERKIQLLCCRCHREVHYGEEKFVE